MRKKQVLFFILFTLFALLNAAQVTSEQARVAAQNWCDHWSGVNNVDYRIDHVLYTGDDNSPGLYLFTLAPKGFVLLSGDDSVTPVLGYGFESTTADVPESLLEWLSTYNPSSAQNISAVQAANNYSAWRDLWNNNLSGYTLSRNVDPMISSTWGEGTGWNNQCPTSGTGPGSTRCQAGSGPVAMAQVMRKWNYPTTGTGNHSYTWNTRLLYANFGTTTYNWDTMPNSLSNNTNVCQLIYHCGIATEANYSTTYTTSTLSAIMSALQTYFTYDSGMQLLNSSSYTTAAWEQLLRDEMDAGRPVVYQGGNVDMHMHIIDGYQNTNYFHFNWGYNGSYDGYFQLTSLNPNGTDFTSNQQAIVGIQPLLPGVVDEGFENGFTDHNWLFGGQANWQVVNTDHYGGSYCARSGAIGVNSSTQMFLNWNVTTAGEISFYRKVSCESEFNVSHDRLIFYIDDVEQGEWCNITGWVQYSYPVTTGVHTFKWVYQKDGSITSGEDCAWIDNIDLPEGATPLYAPMSFTGQVVTTDGGDDVQLNWGAPTSGTPNGYRIYRNSQEIATLMNNTLTSYLDEDLPNGNYTYWIRAIYTTGLSDPSNSVVINMEVLYPPTSLAANVTSFNDVNLSWTVPVTSGGITTRGTRTQELNRSLTGYRIYRDNTLVGTSSTTSFVHADQAEGTYNYQVSAVYSSGESARTANIVVAVGVPWPPSNLTATLTGSNTAHLAWTAPVVADVPLTGYSIYRNSTLLTSVASTAVSYNDANLANGTFAYYVVANYGTIVSGASNTASVTVEVPYPPRNLRATIASDDVTLNWDAPLTAPSRSLTAYYIYRDGAAIASILNVNRRTYTDYDLPNAVYSYTVKAVYGTVYSEASNAATADVDVNYPPSNLTASVTAGTNTAHLAWSAPATEGGLTRGFIGYHIVRNGVSVATVTSFSQLTYDDANLANGSFTYRVYAQYGSGNSTNTNEVSVSVEVLYPPRNLTSAANGDDVTLAWQLPATGPTRSLTGYTIYKNSALLATITNPATLTYADNNLANGTYSYYVKATYTSGSSAAGNTVSQTVEVLYPPTSLTAVLQNNTTAHLTWTAAPTSAGRSFLGYRIYRNGTAVTTLTAVTYNDTNLANGSYSYTVKAVYTGGESVATNAATVSVEVLYAPRNLTAQVNTDDVTLTWQLPLTGPSRSLTGFKVFKGAALLATITNPATLTYADNNLANGTYSYTVTAVYTTGESAASNTATVTVEVLYAPRNLTAQVNTDDVTLTWQQPVTGPSRSLTGYKVYRGTTLISTITNPATLTYADNNRPNGPYSYTVTAVYTNGESAASNAATATVEVLYAPRNLAFNLADYRNVTLSWQEPLTQAGSRSLLNYHIYRNGTYYAQTTALTYVDNNLPDGTYDYYVTAMYTSGESAASNTVSVTAEFPWPPANLAAAVNGSTVNLTWNQASSTRGLLGYNVYRGSTLIASTSTPAVHAYADNNLANGTYNYHVTARYTVGESTSSNTVSATVEVMYTPRNLTAVVTGDDVTLNWQLPATAPARSLTGFKVFRDGNLIHTLTGTAVTTYTDTNLNNGTYAYTVTATYTSGESAVSNTATATVEVLYVPRNLTAQVSSDDVILNWQLPVTGPSRSLTGFKVYRGSILMSIINNPATLTYTDNNLNNGTYSYTVKAVYTSGDSDPGNIATVTVDVAYPPRNLAYSVNGDDVTLNWQLPIIGPNRSLTGFKVYRDGTLVGSVLNPITLTYTDNNLNNGSYTYTVTAVYTSGESAASNAVIASVEVTYPPRNLTALVNGDDVSLTWQWPATGPTRNLTGFNVYRDNSVIAHISAGANHYEDNNLNNGTYAYMVVAEYTSGESDPSNTVVATVEVLYPPRNLASLVNGDDVTLTWQQPVSGPSRSLNGYKVYRDGLVIANVTGANTLTYADNNLNNGTYDYTVTAVYTTGESAASNTATTLVEVLYPPTGLTAQVSTDDVTLTWLRPVNGPSRSFIGYHVYRDTQLIGTIPNPATLTYTDNNLNNGTYNYTVTAFYTSGESVPSNIATAMVEVLYVPRSLIAQVNSDDVTLTWQQPLNGPVPTRSLNGYKVYRDGNLITSLTGAATLTYTDNNLNNGTYAYTVTAVYTTGESAVSNSANATVEVLYVPRNLAALVNGANVSLTWQQPVNGPTRNLNGYKVYRDGNLIASPDGGGSLAYADNNLANGTYTYTVTAVYTTGESAVSNAANATVEVLYMPRNLTALVNGANVSLTWQQPVNGPNRSLNGYKVYRDGNLIASPDGAGNLAYTDNNLANGTYTYTVTAVYTIGESAAGNTANATVEVLYVPQNLTTAVSGDDVTLTWEQPISSPNRSLNGYKVYRNGSFVASITGATSLEYTDSNLANATYVYTVTAVYTNGESAASNTASAMVEVLYAPRNLIAALVGNNNVQLNWQLPAVQLRSLNGYVIYRNGEIVANITNPATLVYNDLNLPNGDYSYTVDAYYTTGVSVPSNSVNINVNYNPLLIPATSLIATVIGTNTVNLAWQATDHGQTGYQVYRNGSLVTELSGWNTLSYTDENLTSGEYSYYVCAVYQSGLSSPTNTVYVDIMVTSAPGNLTGTVLAGNTVQLNWNAPLNPGCTGYMVYRNGVVVAVVNGVDQVSFTENTVPNGTHVYMVKALFGNLVSQPSNSISLVVEYLFPARNLTAVVEGSAVRLSWATPAQRNLVDYQIYRDGTQIGTATNNNYSDDGLANGTYSYYVKAEYTSGVSNPTATVQATVAVSYPPRSFAVNVVEGNNAELTWQLPATGPTRSLTGYTVFRNGIILTSISNPATLSYTDANLPNGSYNYHVSAIYSNGEAQSSPVVNAVIAILYSPTDFVTAVTGTNASISWSVSNLAVDRTGFNLYRNSTLLTTLPANTLEYTDSNLPNGTYTYAISTVYPGGESNRISFQPITVEIAYMPTGLTAQVTGNYNVNVSWQTPPLLRSLLGYHLYRNNTLIYTGTNTSYPDINLLNGSYSYSVNAYYTTGESARTTAVNVQILYLPVPTNLTGTVHNGNHVTLAWQQPQSPTALTGAKVYRNGLLIGTVTGTTATFEDTGLFNNTYSYSVSSLYGADETAQCAATNVTIDAANPPRNLSVVTNGNQNTLTWQAPTDTAGLTAYRVYRNNTVIATITNTATLTYSDTNLNNGNYAYQITAYYSASESDYTNTVNVIVMVFYAPTALEASIENNRNVRLTWQAPAQSYALTGFKVYRNSALVATVDTTTTQWLDENLVYGTYHYQVSALYSTGESDRSNNVSVNITGADDNTAQSPATCLLGNYPNPFNPKTCIRFAVKAGDTVRLQVFNSRGQLVRNLGSFAQGNHQVEWNGQAENGTVCASGVYLYRLEGSGKVQTKRMMMLK